ncbi:MAG: C69 family dipeptidase [Pseudomonadota bacterium]
MIITPGASADGAMTVTHSDDDELADQRIIRVPAMDHAPGAMRPVMPERYPFPRLNTKGRGPHYDLQDWPHTEPTGVIPQVAHTYAYFDGNYGIMNEHNLMMGECTNAARYQPGFVSAETAEHTGKHIRLFYSNELSRVALERCKTARHAIEVMGEMIDTYGFFGEGETLLVADQKEAWVFELCALPDEGDAHSCWVAQRVPDGEIFVAANTFRIREVPSAAYEQIHTDDLAGKLEKVGYYDPKEGGVDWLKAISPGEYNHPYYSLRRIWRMFDRMNPDLGLSPWVEGTYTTYYPFSIKPRARLKLQEIFNLYRDHYEGTEFDLTRGTAAGPYGDPHRFTGPYDGKQNDPSARIAHGAWERAISVFYQGYTFVLQTRPDVPEYAKGIMWLAPDVSATSVFAPFYAKVAHLPDSYQTGNPRAYDPDVAWWVFDFLANWVRLNFQRMMTVDVTPKQQALEEQMQCDVADMDAHLGNCADPVADATAFCSKTAEELLETWRVLGHELIAKYSDGYINRTPEDDQMAVPIGYPARWLAQTDYANGPTSYAMKNER